MPSHMIEPGFLGQFTEAQHETVAEAIATCWRSPHTGLDRIKDFFVTGLVSVEEIQSGLPRRIPLTLVEDAVALIIRQAAPQFTQEAWNSLVLQKLKSRDQLEAAGVAARGSDKKSCPVSLDSPKSRPCSGKSREDEVSSMETMGPIGKIPTTVAECLTMKRHIVDWSTAAKKDCAGSGGTASFKEELVSSLKAKKTCFTPGGSCDVDPVEVLSLNLHTECEGPYLARAFVHCCEIYDKQKMRR